MIGAPDMLFIRPTVLLVFDRLKDELTLLAPVFDPMPANLERARDALDAAEQKLDAALPAQAHNGAVPEQETAAVLAPGAYGDMVARAKDYIAAGDVFQVVLAQRFVRDFTLPPFDLYRALRRINPSPFLYFLNLPGFAVVGSSPEILVRLRDGKVTIRPIAGTRPRGADAEGDRQNRESLLADPKELAEHLMLLDLGRNDVGRVAKPGTVRVTEQYSVEFYSHVMHIVSNVEGDIAPGKDVLAALFAGFPAGTVSGAPKIRAMEVIHELESEKRGIYGGGVGYFGADGSMDSCIVLRTAIVKEGKMHVQAGAGIVADSDPVSEQKECEAKSGALLAAAREAYRVAAQSSRGQ
jgi:anthranilate synthase component I